MEPKAAAIYARISEDRNGDLLGVNRQLKDCTAYAELKGWTIADHYVDDDVSAYRGKARPEYRRLLADIQEHRIDGVVVWHLDRLHRQPKELEEFLEVCDKAGVQHLATVSGDVDLSTHDGRFHARILGAVARKSSDDMARRAARKALEIAEQGRRPGGTRPYGYTLQREPVNAEAEVVREVARRLLAGETLRSLAAELNLRGLPTARGSKWSGQTLKGILIHPRNAGLSVHRDRIVGPALWPAILDPDEFKRVRALLTDPARRTTRSVRRYLLGSLLYCGHCGAKLVSRPTHGTLNFVCAKGPGFYGCGRLSIRTLPTEEFVVEAVLYRLDSPALAAALERRQEGENVGELEAAIAADQAQLEELATMWSDRKIESAEYLLARKRISDRLAAARSRFARLDRHSSLRGVAGQGGELRRRWPDMNLHQRRAVIDAILDRVIVGPSTGAGWRFDPARLQPVWRV